MTARSARFYAEPRDGVPPARTAPRRLGVVVGLFSGPRLLLEQRADADVWSLVGGAVRDDESVLVAAAREVHEETGLELRNADLIAVVSDPARIAAYPDGNVVALMTVVLAARVSEGAAPVCSCESRRLAFFAFDELPLEVAATHRAIVPLAFAWRAGARQPYVD